MSEDREDSQSGVKGVGKAASHTRVKKDQYKRPLDAWKLKKRARPVLSMNFAVTPSPASMSSQQIRPEEQGDTSDEGPPRRVREADRSLLQQQQQKRSDDKAEERSSTAEAMSKMENGSESEESDEAPKQRRETSFKSTRKVFSPKPSAELQTTSVKRKTASSQRKQTVQTALDVSSRSKVAKSTRKKQDSDFQSVPREGLKDSRRSVGNSMQQSRRETSEGETSSSDDKTETSAQRASRSAFSSIRTDNESLGNVDKTVGNSRANESKTRGSSSSRQNITSSRTTDTQATINTQTRETASQPTRKRVKRSEVTLPQETLDVFERRRQDVTQNYLKMSQSHVTGSHVAGHVTVDRSRDPEEAERRREYLRHKRALRERAPEVTTPGAPTSQEETEGARTHVYKEAEMPQTMQDVSLLRVEDFKRRKQLGQITDLDVSHSLLMTMAKEHEIEEEDFKYFKAFVKTTEQELAKSVGAALEFKRRKTELNRSRRTAEDLCKTLMALYDKRHKLRVEYETRRNPPDAAVQGQAEDNRKLQ